MRTNFVLIFSAFVLANVCVAQNKLSIEAGLDVSSFSKSGIFQNADRIKTGIFIKSTYTIFERDNFNVGLGLSFKKGTSLDEFYDYNTEPNSPIALPIYNKDGIFKQIENYNNIQLPLYLRRSIKLSKSTGLLVSLENYINIISSSTNSYFERGIDDAFSEYRSKIYFDSYLNPGLNISLLFKEHYKVGLYAQLNNSPEEHKSIGILLGILL